MILPPIDQVGWASASSTVTSSRSAAVRPRNGPPDAVITISLDGPGPLAGDELVQGRVLGVDGDDRGARGLGELRDELAADDERLLVGQGEVDPLPQRRHARPEAGRADERVEHEVGARLDDELDEALGAGQHVSVGPVLGRRGRRCRRRPSAIRSTPCSRAWATSGSHEDARRGRRARGRRRAATTSSACVPIEPVEPRISSRRMPPRIRAPRSAGKRGQAVEQLTGRRLAPGEAGQRVGLVGRVDLVLGQPEAADDHRVVRGGELGDDRDAPARAHERGGPAGRPLERRAGDAQHRVVGIEPDRRAEVGAELDLGAGGQGVLEAAHELVAHRLQVLPGREAQRDERARPRGGTTVRGSPPEIQLSSTAASAPVRR